jgi:hypothetical protein
MDHDDDKRNMFLITHADTYHTSASTRRSKLAVNALVRAAVDE